MRGVYVFYLLIDARTGDGDCKTLWQIFLFALTLESEILQQGRFATSAELPAVKIVPKAVRTMRFIRAPFA